MSFRKISSRCKSDRADSTIVTFVLILPLFFSFLMTMIDTSVYFANRSIIQQVGRDAARTIAIYGGSGTAGYQSPLENAYGEPNACKDTSIPADVRAWSANQTSIECSVADKLNQGAGLTNVSFKAGAISCGPAKAGAVGAETFCLIKWNYKGIPGAATNFIAVNSSSEDAEGGSLFYANNTRVTSESEVNMTGIPCVPRSGSAGGSAC